jgi:hypothetical protein
MEMSALSRTCRQRPFLCRPNMLPNGVFPIAGIYCCAVCVHRDRAEYPMCNEASTADRLGRIECRTATQAATGVCHRTFDLTSVDVLGEP